MSFLKRLRYLLPGVRREEERDMREELASLAAMAERGELGNLTLAAERRREVWGWTWLEQWLLDGRHAARTLRHNPLFTAAALLTLALGIGATTAVFSVVDAVLLKPLPYPKAEELVTLRQNAPGAAGLTNFVDGLRLSASMYFTYSEQNQTFQSLGIWTTGNANVTGLAEPQQVRTVFVSNGVLQALNVSPEAYRLLLADDFTPHGASNPFGAAFSTTVILSHAYWQRHFGGDRSAIGRTLTIDARPYEIVGVMPPEFRVVNAEADLIIPMAFDRGKTVLAGFAFRGIGRLKPGVTIAQANADLARLLPVWRDSWTNGRVGDGMIYESWKIAPALRPLKQEVVGNVSDVLWVVMATLGLVMLIACANVTNLMLVRAEVRQQELALERRSARAVGRIVRALMVESVLLGAGWAAWLGVALCAWKEWSC